MFSKDSARLVKRSYGKWERTSVTVPDTLGAAVPLQHLSWYYSNLCKDCEAFSLVRTEGSTHSRTESTTESNSGYYCQF